ncbi:hypothetical protein Tco_1574116 [Tanacetum coccineum]
MALQSCLMPMVLISKSTATVLSTTMEGIHHHWLSETSRLSLRTTEFRDRVELATRINPTFQESSRVPDANFRSTSSFSCLCVEISLGRAISLLIID